MKKKINPMAVFIIFYPLIFWLFVHFVINHVPHEDYFGYPIVGALGCGVIFWWQKAKILIFAEKIEHRENKRRKNELKRTVKKMS